MNRKMISVLGDLDDKRVILDGAVSMAYAIEEAMDYGHGTIKDYVRAVGLLANILHDLNKDTTSLIDEAFKVNKGNPEKEEVM